MFVCLGELPEQQHLQPGVRPQPCTPPQARRSHDAPGALALLPVRGHAMVPLAARQLRYPQRPDPQWVWGTGGTTDGLCLYDDRCHVVRP